MSVSSDAAFPYYVPVIVFVVVIPSKAFCPDIYLKHAMSGFCSWIGNYATYYNRYFSQGYVLVDSFKVILTNIDIDTNVYSRI